MRPLARGQALREAWQWEGRCRSLNIQCSNGGIKSLNRRREKAAILCFLRKIKLNESRQDLSFYLICFKDYQPGRVNGSLPLAAYVFVWVLGTCAPTRRNSFLETCRPWQDRQTCSSETRCLSVCCAPNPRDCHYVRETGLPLLLPSLSISICPPHLCWCNAAQQALANGIALLLRPW